MDYVKTCQEAISLADSIKLILSKPRNIIFAGMGGSGISSNLIKDILADSLEIPIEISKSYTLPAYANSETLFICTSYSGNTEETLKQFVEALKKKCSIISITSGGKLLEWSRRFNVPVVKLPEGLYPRDSLPYQFFSLIGVLENLNIWEFSEGKREFIELLPTIDLTKIDSIAQSIKHTLPILYGSSDFSGVLRRIKSQLNENSKMVAKFDEIPELNHNEVVGFEAYSYPYLSAIFLQDRNSAPEISKRVEITKEILKGRVTEIHEIWSYGISRLARVMTLVYQGDYLSVKLAEINNVNRGETKTIDKVKQDIKSLNTVEMLERELETL